jgi:hypothetical protein
MAGSSTFADQKEKGIYRCQEILITLTLLSFILLVQVNSSYGQMSQGNSSSQSVNPVLQWNSGNPQCLSLLDATLTTAIEPEWCFVNYSPWGRPQGARAI